MKIDNNNINDILTSQDKEFIFSKQLSAKQIFDVIQKMTLDNDLDNKCDSSNETNKKNKQYIIKLEKGFNTQVLIDLFKCIMNIDFINQLSNDSLIINVMSLIKQYNTFNDEFFSDDRIFFDSIEQFLDTKIALQDEMQQISNLIANYFISIFRSINKTEYTVLDSYEEMPDFFKSVFLASDLVTLSSILAVVPKDYMFNLKFIKGAHLYVSQIIQRYQLASTLMDNFFRDLKK